MSDSLTKKLMNYISSDNKTSLNKNSNYDTIGNSYTNNPSDDTALNVNSLSSCVGWETNERNRKLIRFADDYCRASPNINLKSKTISNIGWRTNKFNFDVGYEIINYNGEKQSINSIMSAIPINKSVLKFEDSFIRESFSKVLKYLTSSHKNILNLSHFDILPSQKLMIKIQTAMQNGSLRDLLYKSKPSNNFSKKYSPNSGKALNKSLTVLYSKQVLEALVFLHSNRWYHMHLHSGNILISEDSQTVKLTELENFVNDLPIRNEHYFYYAYENFSQFIPNSNSTILSEIFNTTYNIFEKVDIILFGRVLYEMTTGKELKSIFPDDLEYRDMDSEIAEILKLIFNKKTSKVNSQAILSVPEVSATDLLKLKLFVKGETDKENLLDECNENLWDNMLMGDFDNYCSFIKDNIFNQPKFLKIKLKNLSSLYKDKI